MALKMSKATVGYNRESAQTLLSKTNIDVVQKATKSMKKNLNVLKEEVDKFWRGEGAEQFKKNMEADVNNICTALETAHKSLESEIYRVINEMGDVDKNLVKSKS